MKRSVLSALQVWPGVSPWITDWGGAAAQAASSAGASNRTLRIDGLLLGNAAHLQLAVDDGEGEPPFDQVERVFAELLEAPATQDAEVGTHTGGQRLQVVRPRNEARRNAR